MGAAGFGATSGARGAVEATGARSSSPSSVCGSVFGAVPKPLAGPDRTAERIMERCHSPSAELSGAAGALMRERLGVLKETARVHTETTASDTASIATTPPAATPSASPVPASRRACRTGNAGT